MTRLHLQTQHLAAAVYAAEDRLALDGIALPFLATASGQAGATDADAIGYLVNRAGLSDVLLAVAEVCRAYGEALLAKGADGQAQRWFSAAGRIDNVAIRADVEGLGGAQ